jgi:hypothetical protein
MADMLTQTWSIVPREEAEFEHAFKIETHAIHSDADEAALCGRATLREPRCRGPEVKESLARFTTMYTKIKC